MELEQIAKKLDWLDNERRNDKTAISKLEERLKSLEENLSTISQEIKENNTDFIRTLKTYTKTDHFNESFDKHRSDVREAQETIEKKINRRIDESEKLRQVEVGGVEEQLSKQRELFKSVLALRREFEKKIADENKFVRLISENRDLIEALRQSEEDTARSYRILEDRIRKGAKRSTDMQRDVSSLRKWRDEHREQLEKISANMSKLDSRMEEISRAENERREDQDKWIEAQSLVQAERVRQWKNWKRRFETIEKQTVEVEEVLQAMDVTHRSVKQTKESVDKLSKKVDRRTNEISEVQRLAEERFQKEWATYKADDQKRWKNYNLSQDEQRGEIIRQSERLEDRIATIEDSLQNLQDALEQVNEITAHRLQKILSAFHEFVSDYSKLIE